MKKYKITIFSLILILLIGCNNVETNAITFNTNENTITTTIKNIPVYENEPSIVLNNNIPLFTNDDITKEPFEYYSDLDDFNRCGVAFANICLDTMPTTDREQIGHIKPSGWHTIKYNDIIDDNYLYNRCHLIGYQLSGENANEKNLITGTRYLNIQGMLPYENMVAEYVKRTNNHVLYRVTPVFEKNNLVANGVIIEAYSIEDQGLGICFNVYCYNVQPGIKIDYKTGESQKNTEIKDSSKNNINTYVLNTNTKKIHTTTCESIQRMAKKNKQITNENISTLLEQGYTRCKICN